VTLHSEVVVSADGATVGGHAASFLRGSVFWVPPRLVLSGAEEPRSGFFSPGGCAFSMRCPLEGRRAFSVLLSFSLVKGEPGRGTNPSRRSRRR
jgi:hypothetical protein